MVSALSPLEKRKNFLCSPTARGTMTQRNLFLLTPKVGAEKLTSLSALDISFLNQRGFPAWRQITSALMGPKLFGPPLGKNTSALSLIPSGFSGDMALYLNSIVVVSFKSAILAFLYLASTTLTRPWVERLTGRPKSVFILPLKSKSALVPGFFISLIVQ